AGLGRSGPEELPGELLAHRWPVLEAVARTAPDDPDVVEGGVAVDHEVAARRALVLAHPGLEQGRQSQRGEPLPDELAHSGHALRGHEPIAAVGIEGGAVTV